MGKLVLPDLIFVQGGSFMMGIEADPVNHCAPAHRVVLDNFYVGRTAVTIGQYKYFCKKTFRKMPALPTWYSSDEQPMVDISWRSADLYCKWLSSHEKKKYQLLTEAQWEFAAKGGIHSKEYEYSGSDVLDEVAWNELNSDNQAHIVGMKRPNELGIFDMSGNVREFCNDWYESYYYRESPEDNPQGPPRSSPSPFGHLKVVRGGSYKDPEDIAAVYMRERIDEDGNYPFVGFRVAMIP